MQVLPGYICELSPQYDVVPFCFVRYGCPSLCGVALSVVATENDATFVPVCRVSTFTSCPTNPIIVALLIEAIVLLIMFVFILYIILYYPLLTC